MSWSDHLTELFPAALPGHIESIACNGEALFLRHAVAGHPLRMEHLLAQIGHESAGLSVLEENLHYSVGRLCAVWPTRFADRKAAEPFAGDPERLANAVYGGRMGNGDAASGDGWRFRGRGYIQITGRQAYRASGRYAGLDLEARPELAAVPEHALAVACGYWQWRGLNAFCDRDDIVALTRRINGGLHGLADRRAWLAKVRRVLWQSGRPVGTATVVALQRALQDRGYGECGAADGLVGPRTLAALGRFRLEHDLPGTGIDGVLLEALGIGLDAGTEKRARPPGMAGAGPGDLRPGEVPQDRTATLSRLNSR